MEITFNNWLITGGCGFIGISLISHLLNENPSANIRILDNLTTGDYNDLLEITKFVDKDIGSLKEGPSKIELIKGDIRDYETCFRCCEGINTVVHLAANTGVAPSIEKPRLDLEVNVIGTFNMLEASRHKGIKKFIFASSGATLGDVEPPLQEDKTPRPISPYGASKLAGENYCSVYYRTYGLKTVSLRFGNVYGPRSKHKSSVVARFFKRAINGNNLEIYGDGNQTRDFIYIDDMLSAIMLSMKADIGGEVFQIATYKETTINELAEKVKKIVEEETGKGVTIIHTESKCSDVKRNYSDISKANKLLGYKPNFDLYSGLINTFYYFNNIFAEKSGEFKIA